MITIKYYKVSDVFLTYNEVHSLKKLENSNTIKNSKHIDRLLRYELIQLNYSQLSPGNMPTHNGTFSITDFGKDYLLYLRKFNRMKFFEWVRYLITTAIAVIALIRTFLKP